MNKKRSIVISAVAVLVIIIGVAVFLANTRTTVNAQPIPVTGLSNAGGSQPNQIAQQNQAANNKRESAEEIQAQQGLQAIKAQSAQAVRSSANSLWVPGQEFIQGPPAPAINLNDTSRWVPGQEYR